MSNAFIVGLGTFLPGAPVSNDQIETVLGLVNGEPSWAKDLILGSCGIKNRHYAIDPETRQPTYSNAEMSAFAIQNALDKSGIKLDQLDLLGCGTSSPDQLNPSHAAMVHGALGGQPLEVISTSGFCASSIAALRYAYLSILSGQRSLAAVTGSEIASAALRAERFHLTKPSATPENLAINPILSMNKEFLRWILSDGASSAIVAPQPLIDGLSLRIDWLESASFAHQHSACMYAGAVKERATGKLRGWMQMPDLRAALDENVFCLTQDVDLLKRSIISTGINEFFGGIVKRRELNPATFNWFLPHLSSCFFREPLAAAMASVGCDIPSERWFTNLPEVGNLGSASMFCMLDAAMQQGLFQRGQKVLCGIPESGRFTFCFMQLTVV